MKTKILMVCLGNICRSPLAEGILKSKLSNEACYIDSAGTGNWHTGKSPDPRSIAIAHEMGVDITQQRARQLTQEDFVKFDFIYAMDKTNLADVLDLAPNEELKAKVSLLLNECHPGMDYEVPDPYFGGNGGFYRVYDMIDEACEQIAAKFK